MKKHFKIFDIIIFIAAFFSLCLMSSCSIFDSNSSYDVTNEYFTFLSFKPSTYTKVNLQTGMSQYEYVITVTSNCEVSLYEYEADVTLYSSSNEELISKTVTQTTIVSANSEFSFDILVDYTTQKTTSSVKVTYSGKSHTNPKINGSEFKVTFVYNNDTPNKTIRVKKGQKVSTPSDPVKKNHIFKGWFTDEKCSNKYDFSSIVIKSFTLYADYDLDAVTITNEVSRNTMRSIVKVYSTSYNSFLGIETSTSTKQGSGFCFHIENGYYYILTNCHVAIKDSSYDHLKFTIEDYLGNKYSGHYCKSKNIEAIAASYDLACLYFKPSSTTVTALKISSNPKISDSVISLGSPNGQSNFITYGKVTDYNKVTLSNTPIRESNVNFDVIVHTAWIDGGSSGGPLLNSDLQVIGVNYAGTDKKYSSEDLSFAIPASKVNEFLHFYVYN